MAKEFKDWDKKFSRAQIEACRVEWLDHNLADALTSWHFGYKQPSIEGARWAVYEADGFEEWQLFRVSLKGLDTSQKLSMLHTRWQMFCGFEKGTVDQMAKLEIETARIWNYIGALRRGGQLNAELEIVK